MCLDLESTCDLFGLQDTPILVSPKKLGGVEVGCARRVCMCIRMVLSFFFFRVTTMCFVNCEDLYEIIFLLLLSHCDLEQVLYRVHSNSKEMIGPPSPNYTCRQHPCGYTWGSEGIYSRHPQRILLSQLCFKELLAF